MKNWQRPAGALRLGRFPYDGDAGSLQAWNGADTLLDEHLTAQASGRQLRVLLVNDAFGALACASLAAGHDARSQNDSWLARLATNENLRRNGMVPAVGNHAGPESIDSLSAPAGPDWHPDVVLMQLPKSLALLDFQLALLASCLEPGTEIAAGGLTKDVHSSTIACFERRIGPARTSLAAHKARLIHSRLEAQTRPADDPGRGAAQVMAAWPRWRPLDVPGLPRLELACHAGVYGAAAGRPDQGSLLLLRTLAGHPRLTADLPHPAGPLAAIDCGCGDGLLALAAARLIPDSRFICADESFMAIASTRAGAARAGLETRVDCHWTDCLAGLPETSAGLVLCNPPFHQGQGQTLAIARRMFADAARCLLPGGLLLVVANRHLGHHRSLENWFNQVRVVADDGKFMVIAARGV